VVDDEPVIIDLCVEFFQSREQVTDAAATGMEALRKIEAGDYAVVVTDLKMPRMSGIQLYESAVKIKPEMKARFIFLTGDPTVLTSQAPASVSDVPCLMKPVDFYKLEEMVRTVANGGMGSDLTPDPTPH
jgi:two-component system response regulator AtoC